MTTPELCMCGAIDCPKCYPGPGPEPRDRHLKYALEEVVDSDIVYDLACEYAAKEWE